MGRDGEEVVETGVEVNNDEVEDAIERYGSVIKAELRCEWTTMRGVTPKTGSVEGSRNQTSASQSYLDEADIRAWGIQQ